jgi:hypothetical protein
MSALGLTAAETARLNALADALIPAGADAISASGAGVFGTLLPAALGYAPEILPFCRKVLAALPDGAGIAALRTHDPALFERFAETVAAIYFMSSAVRAAVGFPGRAAVPARIDPADLEELLLPVLAGDFEPRPA